MNYLFIVLLIGIASACSEAVPNDDTTEPTDNTSLVSDKADQITGKADEEPVLECANDADDNTGCDLIGAECCGQPGLTCQEYTVYDYPRCRPPVTNNFYSFQTDTRGGRFACTSAPESTFPNTQIDIVGTDVDGNEDFSFVNLTATRVLMARENGTAPVENGSIEGSLADYQRSDERLDVSTYYYDLRTEAVEGMAGIYTGQFISKISDDVWEVDCWEEWVTPTARYDQIGNRCIDSDGEPALNPTLRVPALRGMKFAECMDFANVEIDEGVYGYQTYGEINFAGSSLSGAALHFAHIMDADLRGTDLSGFDFGYANVEGVIDANTIGSEFCPAEGDQLSCSN